MFMVLTFDVDRTPVLRCWPDMYQFGHIIVVGWTCVQGISNRRPATSADRCWTVVAWAGYRHVSLRCIWS